MVKKELGHRQSHLLELIDAAPYVEIECSRTRVVGRSKVSECVGVRGAFRGEFLSQVRHAELGGIQAPLAGRPRKSVLSWA
eukprot:587868-Amphidinium_carterae.1